MKKVQCDTNIWEAFSEGGLDQSKRFYDITRDYKESGMTPEEYEEAHEVPEREIWGFTIEKPIKIPWEELDYDDFEIKRYEKIRRSNRYYPKKLKASMRWSEALKKAKGLSYTQGYYSIYNYETDEKAATVVCDNRTDGTFAFFGDL